MSEFKNKMKEKYPSINVEEAIKIFDENIAKIKENPIQKEVNPDVVLPLDCDLNKNIFLRSMFEYIEFKQTEVDNV
jgi:hypothetical protein